MPRRVGATARDGSQQPRQGEPGYVAPAARISMVRRMLERGASESLVIEWCATITPGPTPAPPRPASAVGIDRSEPVAAELVPPPERLFEVKLWAVGERKAREYIERAKILNARGAEDSQQNKLIANRSRTLYLVHRAIEGGDLYAAIRAQHMLNLIDRSYEESVAKAISGAVSQEEAIARIDHAASTLALARSRGVIPEGSKVIEVDASEDDADDEPQASVSGN